MVNVWKWREGKILASSRGHNDKVGMGGGVVVDFKCQRISRWGVERDACMHMYVCMYVCMYVYTYVCRYVCVRMYVCMCTCICKCAHVFSCACVCVYVCI